MSKAKSLLPTFIGALGGVYLVVFGERRIFILAVVVAAILLALLLSVYKWFARSPRLWGAVLESWILFLPVITALAVSLLLWSTVREPSSSLAHLPGWTPGQEVDLIKYLAGAVTGLAAAVASEDPEKNIFWPDFQFKRVAGKAVSDVNDKVRFYAAYMPSTFCNEVEGWGLRARLERARQLA